MVHLAMHQNDESGSPVTWGRHVTGDEYAAAQKRRRLIQTPEAPSGQDAERDAGADVHGQPSDRGGAHADATVRGRRTECAREVVHPVQRDLTRAAVELLGTSDRALVASAYGPPAA